MNKFQKIVATSIYVHPDRPGFQGYEDAGIRCERESKEQQIKLLEDLSRKLTDGDSKKLLQDKVEEIRLDLKDLK